MSVSTPRAVVAATPVAACAAFLIGIGAVGCSSLDAESDNCDILDLPGCNPVGGANGGSGGTSGEPSGIGGMPVEWQCLVADDLPLPRPATPGRVTYVFPVVDFDTDPLQPIPLIVPGAQLTVCTTAACSTPAGPEVTVTQDPMRPFVWVITMPNGLGAVSIRARAEGYVDTDYYVGGPMVGTLEGSNTVIALALPMPKVASVDNLLSNIGLPPLGPNAAVGILALRTLDCSRPPSPLNQGINQGSRAQRVRVELVTNDPNTDAVPWVLSVGNQASRDLDATDGRGVAGFANLEPRVYRVRGIAPAPVGSETGTEIGATSATVRPNTITLVEIRDGIDIWGQ